ncbi:SMG-7 SUPPRESSOR WITH MORPHOLOGICAL EFFECT ON GENITALIA PROTEIN 7 [Salix viminalis]|uniref:SMG-7 SUPPRESSOR WITH MORPHOLOGICAL EFFECT ON GENITALIA PROTEIN 7 n=1 Tax=Salix viminalis TaxID=40686 RepID=A0A9Q0V479_SALVM|nr:SMG-7 SUPPRESSOR WITH MORPHOLOGICAL EFFECT ON GENITALIA PROTEIN 7 [Salix viminalis]KAJ6741677.1 SMG-7 SUPPRESSOR WITH MORPHOLOGICAL EFFECT ON GENITALIA PROTEIN 7 [Salix viminalis]
MTVPMDNPVDLSSRGRVQRLYDKNVELGNRLRRSAQARIPSDFTVWQQMRDNYEAIILEDHAFSEQHEIEYALWQLHYRRIEEFRTHCKAALASNGSVTSQNGTMVARPERITKIRSQFKTFLSEATGFYHDLMLKVRAKCGLPLVSFSDNAESQNIMSGEGNKATMMRKGLISCNRCLIYLGDLSRYKGLYGEGDSKTRDFSAASSYYKQASSLWPSSGNPHHQLGILATYSGGEFEAIYCYFRSLAIDNPFSTARDNLIIEFEKNRQSFSQLCGDAKASLTKNATRQIGRRGRGRGRGSRMSPVKDNKKDASALKKNTSSIPETLKAFRIRFVRLNGILFTRTSLETFEEVLSVVKSDLLELLSSGSKEEYNFGSSAEDNGLVIVRLISILIFTVYNVNREAKLESYADILQRSVLLQNAFTAIFELMGLIVKRCTQLNDPLTSFLLPGVLIFLEWLACHPDFATGIEVEEHQAAARLYFWENCISFLNRLLSNKTMFIDVDGEDACFSNMSSYDESETSNRLALWEDFELRGFLPLAPAQLILDFSRKQSVTSDVGVKEKKARLQRIIYAGKALVSLVRVGQQGMYFDLESKKFAIGAEPQTAHSFEVAASLQMSSNVFGQNYPAVEKSSVERTPLYMDGEEEDEVIVFKPLVTDRHFDVNALELSTFEVPSNASQGSKESCIGSFPVPCDSHYPSNGFNRSIVGPKSPASVAPLHFQALQPNVSKWPTKANGLNNFNLVENGLIMKTGFQEHQVVLQPSAVSLPLPLFVNPSAGNLVHAKVSDTAVHLKSEPVMSYVSGFDSLSLKASSAFSASSRLNPVTRPVHHLGPPPGFSSVPPKAECEILSGINQENYDLHMDDYSWLDGYQPPLPAKATVFNNTINHPAQSCHHTKANDGLTGTGMFPFPGKQLQTIPMKIESQNGRLNHQLPDHLKLYQEWQQQQHAKIG